tara:strand:- start:2408 stop:3424 length:1017 start_codon:yes stop_codon:yes gene_type:complete
MAFQDSAGGIIIDAALTDLGRKYMAQGKFKVVKFALGDDEINYEFVTKASGTSSATIDDSLLPPVLEAFGSQEANITHGLLNLRRPDILYIPILKTNDKVDSSVKQHSDGYYYLSVNKTTTRKLKEDLQDSNKILNQANYEQNKILIESGIEIPSEFVAAELVPTVENKNTYILNLGLYDKYVLAYADSKLIKNLLVSPSNSIFKNDANNNLKQNFGPLQKAIKISLPKIDDTYEVYKITMTDNKIYQYSSAAHSEKYSAFDGPRASIAGLNFELIPELLNEPTGDGNHRYSFLGNTSNDLFGSGNLYDFIDTTIYIQGLSTNYRLSIPLRIVRYVEG